MGSGGCVAGLEDLANRPVLIDRAACVDDGSQCVFKTFLIVGSLPDGDVGQQTELRSSPVGAAPGVGAVEALVAGAGSTFEFNTRGMLILPGAATTLVLSDASTGHTRNVTVWPSGQVAPL